MSTSHNIHVGADPEVEIEVDQEGPTTVTLNVRSGEDSLYQRHLLHIFVEREMTAEGWRHFATSAAKASEDAFAIAIEMKQTIEEDDES